MTDSVIVGYDGSEEADLAVRWAAEAASSRGLPLKVICVWTLPPIDLGMGSGGGFDGQMIDSLQDETGSTLAKGIALAEATVKGLDVSGEVTSGPPAGSLVSHAADAAIIVLGSQGRGGFTGLLLGSVSRQVAAHVECPAVIVRPAQNPTSREIAVGVDGSESSLRALNFAFQVASRRTYDLRLLHTWEVPPIGAITGVPAFAPPDLLEDLESAEMRTVAEALAGYREQYPDVPVTQDVLRGSPVDALRKASEKAAMVVVGSRGRGGFTGLLLGSVSHSVAHHAKCTVAIVH
jgi:nucleotide-binding universal stress UspA family protein